MKLYITLFLAILLNIFIGNAQSFLSPEINWSNLNLKGKVKELTERSYEAKYKFGDLQKDAGELTGDYLHYKFNENGSATEYSRQSRRIIEYNASGNRISETIYRKNEDNSLSIIETTRWMYDNDGKVIEQNTYNANGNLTSRSKFKYSNNGKLSETADYDKEGNLKTKFLNKYDLNENISESFVYGSDEKLFSKNLYKYDINGKKLIEYTSYLYGNLPPGTTRNAKHSFIYDKNGNLLQSTTQEITQEIKTKKSTSKTQVETYKYNNKSELTEYTSGNPADHKSITTVNYEYDLQSNWIKAVFMNKQSGFANLIKEREIIYY